MRNASKKLDPLKVLIVEDHEFTRVGLAYSLQNTGRFEAVAQAEDGVQAIDLVRSERPDIILMDIGMPKMDGITATQQIKPLLPDVKVIILTSRQIGEEIIASLTAGADAYCMKDITTDKLVNVIDTVLEGAVWLDPAIARHVVTSLSSPVHETSPASVSANEANLSEREQSVLALIAKGSSNKEIGNALSISTHTVKIHVRNLIQKLSVSDRTQAAVKAIQEGLV